MAQPSGDFEGLMAAESTKRGQPENVDAGIASKRGRSRAPSPERQKRTGPSTSAEQPAKRSYRTQNNFSKELSADEMLDFLLAQNEAKKAKKAKSVPARKKSMRTQNNFSRELNADEQLDFLLAQNKVKKLKAGPKAIADGEPGHTKVPDGNAPNTAVAPKMTEKKTYEEVIALPKSKKSRMSSRGPTIAEIIAQLQEMGDKRSNSTLRRMGKETLRTMLNQKATIATKKDMRTASKNTRAIEA